MDPVSADLTPAKRPLHQNALDAYRRGELKPWGRSTTIRPESMYESPGAPGEKRTMMLTDHAN